MSLKQTVLDKLQDYDEEHEERVEEMINDELEQYLESVSEEERERLVLNRLMEEYSDLSLSEEGGAAELVTIQEASGMEDGEWVSLRGEVVDLWDPNHESIKQTGLIRDDSGERMKFTIWDNEDQELEVEMVNEGDQYFFENVPLNMYEGRVEFTVTSRSDVRFLDEEIDIEQTQNYEGVVVQVPSGEDTQTMNGLIKRDEDGNIADWNSDGDFDLRLKMVLDDGRSTRRVVLPADQVEKITGISVEEAKEIAEDTLDRTEVTEKLKREVVCKNLKVEGYDYRGTLVAQDVSMGVNEVTEEDVEKELVRARQVQNNQGDQ